MSMWRMRAHQTHMLRYPPSRMPDTGGSNGLQEQSQRLQVWVYACAMVACNCTLSTLCKGSIERQIVVAADQWSERSITSHYVAVCEWKTVVSSPYIGTRLVVLAHRKAAHSSWHTPTLATIAYKGRGHHSVQWSHAEHQTITTNHYHCHHHLTLQPLCIRRLDRLPRVDRQANSSPSVHKPLWRSDVLVRSFQW